MQVQMCDKEMKQKDAYSRRYTRQRGRSQPSQQNSGEQCSLSVFPDLTTIDFWSQIILCCKGSYTMQCMKSVELYSFPLIPRYPVTSKNVSRRCQVPLEGKVASS